MASQTEIRLRLLERRVEQLAALLLDSTPAELDVNWPEYTEQMDRGEKPTRPKPDPKYTPDPVDPVDPVDPTKDPKDPKDPKPVDPPVDPPIPVDPVVPPVDPPVDPVPVDPTKDPKPPKT